MNVLGIDDPLCSELIGAWNRWETQPGLLTTAEPKERIVSRVAALCGLTSNELHRKLAEHRRAGLGPQRALQAVLSELS